MSTRLSENDKSTINSIRRSHGLEEGAKTWGIELKDIELKSIALTVDGIRIGLGEGMRMLHITY